MAGTTFDTWALRLGDVTEIAGQKPWPQRVLLHNVGAGAVFVSDTAAGRTGTRAIQVPANGPQVIVIAPGQALYAAGDAAGGGTLSASVSASIPRHGSRSMGLSSFDNQPPGQLLDAMDVPRRVTAALPAGVTGQVGVKAALGSGFGPAFRMLPTILYTFVLAPGQALYGSVLVGGPGPFSIHAADLIASAPRGPTGIPGPDGQE